jgi:hypothetical protein
MPVINKHRLILVSRKNYSQHGNTNPQKSSNSSNFTWVSSLHRLFSCSGPTSRVQYFVFPEEPRELPTWFQGIQSLLLPSWDCHKAGGLGLGLGLKSTQWDLVQRSYWDKQARTSSWRAVKCDLELLLDSFPPLEVTLTDKEAKQMKAKITRKSPITS